MRSVPCKSDGIISVELDGLVQVDTVDLSMTGAISSQMSLAGDRVHVRTTESILTYSFDPTTGALGSTPLQEISGTGNNFTGGLDTLALHHQEQLLISPTMTGELHFFDAETGAALFSLEHEGALTRGICLPFAPPVFGDGFESGNWGAWSVATEGGRTPLAIATAEKPSPISQRSSSYVPGPADSAAVAAPGRD